ncbi:WD40/YVTN/BNR-like repeat-containing protein [Rhodohalobacter barkolensis]|uniref:FlgD/Vpr Ig-like domain-containing protein n=1 Tax=Rhodohalobacter barkolensis TaxID=2053187 RepID=A0A2N0VKG8_9BACT|nr:FlgD immunoglobulin-like domain containing protein [Rhodohalobacter barkolensis]PKD44668.1 hypothetical protein CWD77_04175 [Rhodohalobacter barkolensis]
MPKFNVQINVSSGFAAFILLSLIWLGLPEISISQDLNLDPIQDRFRSISQNSITSLEGSGDLIWMGPGLNAYSELSGDIYIPESADSIFAGRGRVFSLQTNQNRIFAGLGFTSDMGDESVQTAIGYYKSTNSGESWQFISFPLDERPPADCTGSETGTPCDLEFEYGNQTYLRTRITVPQLSPPFEVDFYDQTLLSVNWASGLMRSLDDGANWERLILPPASLQEMNPSMENIEWISQTSDGTTVNRYDPRFDNNLLGFGLMIDRDQNVWVGTAGGINISPNALSAPRSEIEWRRFTFDPDTPDEGLLANWIVTIRQQPGTGRVWMTNWMTDPQNRDTNGVVYTDDLGETFQQTLVGVRVNDIGFWEDKIFAAADDGVYVSDNDGNSWEKIDRISSPNSFIKKDAQYYALSSTDHNLWVGTSDGAAYTSDGGESWSILRVDLPLRGGNIYQPDAPDNDTYAYPNPFSPTQHGVVRIKFESNSSGPATIQIYDFGMNPVKTIEVTTSGSGSYEATWNGEKDSGRLVASGTYFYRVNTPSGSTDGKILLLD